MTQYKNAYRSNIFTLVTMNLLHNFLFFSQRDPMPTAGAGHLPRGPRGRRPDRVLQAEEKDRRSQLGPQGESEKNQ